jgi:hypothetical protein
VSGTVFRPAVCLRLDDTTDDGALRRVMDEVFTDTVSRYSEHGPGVKGTRQWSKVHDVAKGRASMAIFTSSVEKERS